jgi:hypothetical protein
MWGGYHTTSAKPASQGLANLESKLLAHLRIKPLKGIGGEKG